MARLAAGPGLGPGWAGAGVGVLGSACGHVQRLGRGDPGPWLGRPVWRGAGGVRAGDAPFERCVQAEGEKV